VACLPRKNRKEVLKILKRKKKVIRRRRSGRSRVNKSIEEVNQASSDSGSSSASVNKDWEHWMVMHGNEKVEVEDVWGIGKATSLTGIMQICLMCCPKRGEGRRS